MMLKVTATIQKFVEKIVPAPHQESFFQALCAGNLAYPVHACVRSVESVSDVHWLNDLPWLPSSLNIFQGKSEEISKLHDSGKIYSLDLSSVFCVSVLVQVPNNSCRLLLDLCASPGGKAVIGWKILSPDLLIANEVIGKRTGALISNLKRCHIAPCRVTCVDVERLAMMLERRADVVIVDAPCSGQSLLVKGKIQSGAFHPATINMNSNRQKRIIANAAKTVVGGGYLAYMTCTFSREENEGVIEWFLKRFPNFETVEVESHRAYQSHLVEFPCYRLWPQQGEGAGGFTTLLRNRDDISVREEFDAEDFTCIWKQEG